MLEGEGTVLCLSPKTIAGIASAVILFVAVVATTICCFLCSCCYLYRRRQHLQSPFEGMYGTGQDESGRLGRPPWWAPESSSMCELCSSECFCVHTPARR